MRTVKTLIRLGWFEFSLGAQSFYWFCQESAQMRFLKSCFQSFRLGFVTCKSSLRQSKICWIFRVLRLFNNIRLHKASLCPWKKVSKVMIIIESKAFHFLCEIGWFCLMYVSFCTIFDVKRPRGRAVSAPDFESRGRGFESRWRQDSSRA